MNHRGKSQREKGLFLKRGPTWAKVVAHILEQKQSDRVKFCGIMNETYRSLGVFLVSAKNAFVPVKHNNSMNTYSSISTVPRGSEQSEWASPWMERVSEASKQASKQALRSGALRSEWAEWAGRAHKRSIRPSSPLKTQLSLTGNAPKVRETGRLKFSKRPLYTTHWN